MSPLRPLRHCTHPGCPELTRDARCPDHRRQRERQRRELRGPRPYDRRLWRDTIRPGHLRREPFCRFCREEDRWEKATDVDHIDGDPLNNAETNLRSLCHTCHSARTMRDQVRR